MGSAIYLVNQLLPPRTNFNLSCYKSLHTHFKSWLNDPVVSPTNRLKHNGLTKESNRASKEAHLCTLPHRNFAFFYWDEKRTYKRVVIDTFITQKTTLGLRQTEEHLLLYLLFRTRWYILMKFDAGVKHI